MKAPTLPVEVTPLPLLVDAKRRISELVATPLTGTWGRVSSRLYERAVARGQAPLYDALGDEVLRDVPAEAREILDVGCGPGHAAIVIARRRRSAAIMGIDSSEEMVRLARRLASEEHESRAQFEVGDATALRFSDEKFDAVYSLASIKHWPDRARGIAEIHRVLKPGGVAAIVEADRGASSESLRTYAKNWPWLPPLALELAFRNIIAGGSIDQDDARALLSGSEFVDGRVGPIPGTPLLVMHARKRR